MRLTSNETNAIRQTVAARFGDSARVLLFGSRTNDTAKGGDIDLLVELSSTPSHPLRECVALETELQIALDDQKVDVILAHPAMPDHPLVRLARKQGIPL